MFQKIKERIAARKLRLKQERCGHVNTVLGSVTSGRWSPPEPHPVPHMREVFIERRRFVNVAVCFDCDKVVSNFGHDQRDLDPELPLSNKVVHLKQ